ncbi:asparagine synthase (glutamine-hydrolyzing) [Clostridium sp. YIM B02515]|uniref:asparagine synthase (glutamine-hydrolyzing) n=1 Tax=Clostridium rhizosphaerae TaxID=2803861 RepID=A0ABS1T8T2_9CLOT|nr:asparagine synthase (glutamine-hydrolyzing) [Clostridium rhizosphaerae]MBL4935750.1 asparagine synthase (glutamine-hydrolyzing) [Clostridium rhizosphaerae]
MCGIAGWINLERQLTNEKYIMENMIKTLAKRGPDDGNVYSAKHALLGHRRLVVVDPSGGAQPMTKTLGKNVYTIVYNGELYNTEEVRDKLKALGLHFKSYSDTEVLLTAYIAWGTDCVKYVNGIYAFGIWDENRNSLFLARDPLGVKPLFYTKKDNSLIFASEIKTLLTHPEIEPILDRDGLLEMFSLGPARSLGSGIFKGIKEIPPAHCMVYNSAGINMWEYWKLESRPHNESIEQTVEHTRSLLIDAVERQLGADVPVCTFLSGGLDSSAISSIASNYFKRNNVDVLNTYSIDYVDNDKYFKASEFQPNSDGTYIQMMSKYIGSRHHNILVSNEAVAAALNEAVLANDLPGMADIDSSLYLFCREVRKDAVVALSGECADEIFGGYPWFRREEDINAHNFPWSRYVNTRKDILSKEFKSLPLEEFSKAKYEESIKKVERLEGESDREYRMREMFYLNIKWFMITLLNRKDRMSMSNSLEVRVPFADHRIVEYAYNIPWEIKYCDNIEKGLLRRALKDILPNEVLYRRKSPYPKTHSPEYLRVVQNWMREILDNKNSPILNLIDKEKVNEIIATGGKSFEKPWYGQLMTGPQLLAYLIQINLWLEKYKVRIQ